MAVVRHGFSTRDFPIVETLPPPDAPFSCRLLLPGRVDERKGSRTAVRALAALPDATLNMVGRGDPAEMVAVQNLAIELGVSDRLNRTACERSLMAQHYSSADVVLFPSEWEEPFGIVGLEAMASGVPVVATGTGGSGEYLEHEENCLIVQPGDADELAGAVRRLANDPLLRVRLVAAGRNTARGLTATATADELERWHLAVCERQANGGALRTRR
jgi:glycosyltransferase involved in cell wall biosynthesis